MSGARKMPLPNIHSSRGTSSSGTRQCRSCRGPKDCRSHQDCMELLDAECWRIWGWLARMLCKRKFHKAQITMPLGHGRSQPTKHSRSDPCLNTARPRRIFGVQSPRLSMVQLPDSRGPIVVHLQTVFRSPTETKRLSDFCGSHSYCVVSISYREQ